jgi:hypothetical protein
MDSEPHVYSESGIYSNLLLNQGRGFPLYRPEPRTNLPEEYKRTGVAIGDVGRVTAEGSFDFFFNIYLPADDPINIDAPKDFVPLSACPSRRDIDDYDLHPGNHISTGIHKLSGFSTWVAAMKVNHMLILSYTVPLSAGNLYFNVRDPTGLFWPYPMAHMWRSWKMWQACDVMR